MFAGHGSSGGDSGRNHGGRVLPSASGRRAVCSSAAVLYYGGDQQLRSLSGTHQHTHTDFSFLNEFSPQSIIIKAFDQVACGSRQPSGCLWACCTQLAHTVYTPNLSHLNLLRAPFYFCHEKLDTF